MSDQPIRRGGITLRRKITKPKAHRMPRARPSTSQEATQNTPAQTLASLRSLLIEAIGVMATDDLFRQALARNARLSTLPPVVPSRFVPVDREDGSLYLFRNINIDERFRMSEGGVIWRKTGPDSATRITRLGNLRMLAMDESMIVHPHYG